MQRLSPAFAVLIALLSAAVHATEAAQPVVQTPDVRVVEQLLRLPEDRLNIGDAALRLSGLLLPDTDVAAGSAQLDAIARSVAELVGKNTEAEYRIRAINTVLYKELGFDYDRLDMMGREPESALLWNYLRTRRGNCVTMPLLWFAVAERLGYPVKAVEAPQHFFLRYEEGTRRINVEATSGSVPSDDSYVRDLEIPQEAIKSGAFMRSLSKREFLAALIGEFAARQEQHMNFGTAREMLEAAVQVMPNSVALHWNLALAYSAIGQIRAAQKAVKLSLRSGAEAGFITVGEVREFAEALKHAHEATALGAPAPLEDGYWKRVKKLGESGTSASAGKRAQPFDVARLIRPERHIQAEAMFASAPPPEPILLNHPRQDQLLCPACPACQSAAFATALAADTCGRCRQSHGSTVDACLAAARDGDCRTCMARQGQQERSRFTVTEGSGMSFAAEDRECGACRLNHPDYSMCKSLAQDSTCQGCLGGR